MWLEEAVSARCGKSSKRRRKSYTRWRKWPRRESFQSEVSTLSWTKRNSSASSTTPSSSTCSSHSKTERTSTSLSILCQVVIFVTISESVDDLLRNKLVSGIFATDKKRLALQLAQQFLTSNIAFRILYCVHAALSWTFAQECDSSPGYQARESSLWHEWLPEGHWFGNCKTLEPGELEGHVWNAWLHGPRGHVSIESWSRCWLLCHGRDCIWVHVWQEAISRQR